MNRLGTKLLAAALLSALGLSGCGPVLRTHQLKLAGAQIPVELVTGWLQRARQPAFTVSHAGPIYLTQDGVQHLQRGDCDLACADRIITSREIADLAPRIIHGRRIAFYGYGLYVNSANQLDSIFAKHLGYLFQGKARDWQELGPAGVQGRVRLIGPAKATRGGDILMRQARIWFAEPTWEVCENDLDVVRDVAGDPAALGFAPIGLDGDGVRYLGLRMDRNGPAAFPSLEEIEAENYGLAKVIYVYWNEPASDSARAAVDFLLSDTGRRAIESTDLTPIRPEHVEVNIDNTPATRPSLAP